MKENDIKVSQRGRGLVSGQELCQMFDVSRTASGK